MSLYKNIDEEGVLRVPGKRWDVIIGQSFLPQFDDVSGRILLWKWDNVSCKKRVYI